MRFTIVTLFPDSLGSPLNSSILGQAQKKGLFQWKALDLREHCLDKHATADDSPFGGGAGPRGRRLTQAYARELAQGGDYILLCSHYEGLDERALSAVDAEVSIGDLVLSGGELAACVLIDTVVRLLPGVLGNQASIEEESFENGLLEHPHYTRPASAPYGDVPPVLLSGDHAAIATWRRQQSLKTTLERRPDLLETAALNEKDRAYLRSLGWQGQARP